MNYSYLLDTNIISELVVGWVDARKPNITPSLPEVFCYTIVSISCLNCPMDEQRQQAYLTLINTLLTCPNGEEVVGWVDARKPNITPSLPEVFCYTIVSIVCLNCPMDEQRQQAYLTLINTLLTCPSGEEGQILQDNAELVDAGLVETMAQVAEVLAGRGN